MILRWIGFVAAFAVCLLSAAHVDADAARPLLMFEIDEGFSNSLLMQYESDYTSLDSCLGNICASLLPLTSKYDVAVLIYPTHFYDRNAYGKLNAKPIDRVHPVLRHALDYFSNGGVIKVILESYSSGIATNQNGALASVPPAPLYDTPSDNGRAGWAMDLDALAALKDAYPNTFLGIRFHELYGSDLSWKISQASGFALDPAVVQGAVDMCSQKGLRLIWSDSAWLMKCNAAAGPSWFVYDPVNEPYFQSDPYKSLQDYAEQQLGNRLSFLWANNNYDFTQNLGFLDAKVGASSAGVERPLPSWLYFSMPFTDFPLKNRPSATWGMNIQSWFWHEMTNTLNGRYYLLGENNCPVEILQAYVLKALNDGASVLSFEPSWYFFNDVYPQWPVAYEENPDFSERLAMKRLKHVLLDPGDTSNPPNDLGAIFDRNQQRFLENGQSNPPSNYSQSTLVIAETQTPQVRCWGSYSYDSIWAEQDQDRYIESVFTGGLLDLCRIELQGDGIDEILTVKNGSNGQLSAELFDQNSVSIGTCPGILDNTSDGQFVTLTSANLISASTSVGDPDEIIVARRAGSTNQLNLRVYQATSNSDGRTLVDYEPLSDAANQQVLGSMAHLSSTGFVRLVGIRRNSALYSDFSRSTDVLAAVYQISRTCYVKALVDGKIIGRIVGGMNRGDRILPLYSNSGRADDLCILRRAVGQTIVDEYSYQGTSCRRVATRHIQAIPNSAHVIGLRKCLLLNGGLPPAGTKH